MRDTPNHGTLVLLEIFARGTYADYLGLCGYRAGTVVVIED